MSLSAAEAAVYDRQLRVWGLETQQRYDIGGINGCSLTLATLSQRTTFMFLDIDACQ